MHFPSGIIIGYATILAALLTPLRLYFKKYRNNWQFVFHLAGSIVCAVFIFALGGWAYLSFYFRWFFLAIYFTAFIFTIQKRSHAGAGTKGLGKWYYVTFRLAFTVALTFIVFAYFEGKSFTEKAVDLKFPFRSGTYYVMQGGANRVVNPAHRNYSVEQYGFAMDISKLYPMENRAKGIMPENVKDYAIYGDTVLSPCDGRVILVEDTVHTNLPGYFNVRYVHGNHVIIQAKGYRVFLAHFIKNRIFVREGERIKAGTPIGLAGNSGFSAEPHLHVNVLKDYEESKDEYKLDLDSGKASAHTNRNYNDYRYSGISYPFSFDGKLYVINDIIEK